MKSEDARHRADDFIESCLTRSIIAAFHSVYNALGCGLLESTYANALVIALRARGLRVEREVPIEVHYLGQPVGRFRLDLVVERKVLVECKATETLSPMARPQVFTYLRCSHYPVALLLHFGPTPTQFRYVKPGLIDRLETTQQSDTVAHDER